MQKEEVKTKTITVDKITEIKYTKKDKGPGWHAGVLTTDGEWININCFSKEDVEDKLKVDGKPLEVGKTYVAYLEIRGKYENLKSFVLAGQDLTYANKSDKEIAQMEAGSPKGEGGGSQSASKQTNLTDYQKREDNKQRMIVRQSSLNYATQIESVFLTWELQAVKDAGNTNPIIEHNQLFEKAKARIKATAKEYEKQIMED